MDVQFFLPHKFRLAGWILLAGGIVAAVMYLFLNFRFQMPVFAVFSMFLETKFLTTFTTNFADELTMLLLVGGLALLAFTREKDEEACSAERQELYQRLRGAALMKAMFYNALFLLFCILFIYGQAFLAVVLINLVLAPVLYLVVFRLLLKKAGLRKIL